MTFEVLQSKASEGASEQEHAGERRRLPRLTLTSDQFRLNTNGKLYSILDLSEGGIALRVTDSAERVLFVMGAQIDGILNLKHEKHLVRLRVKHFDRQGASDRVGCSFESLEPSVLSSLKSFLDPVALGAQLRPIPTSQESGISWFHGPAGVDLLLWRNSESHTVRFTLFMQGEFMGWEDGVGLQTGKVSAAPQCPVDERGVVWFETVILSADESPSLHRIEQAKCLITATTCLSEEQKTWCLSCFSRVS